MLSPSVENIYDVLIVGGGPAGLSTGIYTARQGLKTLIIEENELGGRAYGNHRIENYPGFPEGLSGLELMKKFIAQAERFEVDFVKERAESLSLTDDLKKVFTSTSAYLGKVVVLAIGIQRRQLKILGEMEFKGRGVSYCPVCDGPFFLNKVVAVIGSGEESIEDAKILSDFAEKVYFIPEGGSYNEGFELLEKPEKNEKIEVIEGARVESIHGDQYVSHLKLRGGPYEILKVEGVFINLEETPFKGLIQDTGILTDERGCIQVDKNQQTNIEGVYAVGDCVCSGMQVVTAAGEGGRAGIAALRYVKRTKLRNRT